MDVEHLSSETIHFMTKLSINRSNFTYGNSQPVAARRGGGSVEGGAAASLGTLQGWHLRGEYSEFWR